MIGRANAAALIRFTSSFEGNPSFSLRRGLSNQRHSRYSEGIPRATCTFFMSGETLGVEPNSESTKMAESNQKIEEQFNIKIQAAEKEIKAACLPDIKIVDTRRSGE